jgi:hypothetical protein
MLACMHSATAGGSSWHCLRIPPYGSHAPQSSQVRSGQVRSGILLGQDLRP